MSKNCDITGQRFGRLKAIKRSPRIDNVAWWVCQCDCGNIKEVRSTSLRNGSTKSCGCLSRDLSKKRSKKIFTKHGWYGTRIYEIWRGMVHRCTNPKAPQYKHYGERGINVCNEWREHPEKFCEWGMANGYKDGLTIDRIDNNIGYNPQNCRWISNTKQQRNKRNNVNLTYNGETHCVAEWSEIVGTNKQTIYRRIYAGWKNPKEILFGKEAI